jgi:integrase/recombinase XerD
MTSLAPTLEAFFTSWLLNQRRASPHTIAAYRDTFRLLLRFAQAQLGKPPAQLDLADLAAELIGAFLDHLERQRGNSIRSRNARLAAVHSFFRFAALREPGHAALIQRVLAIPPKRCERALITFLTGPRSTRCWLPPTAPAGPAAAITPCCSPRSRPGCAFPN